MDALPLPILYSFRRCPYAMRARLAMAAARQACHLREVILRDKPAAMLEVSAKGTVPVLALPDGQVIAESLEIMLWALQTHDPEQCLSPSPTIHAEMLALITENDGPFKARLDRYKYPDRFQLQSSEAERDAARPWLLTLDARLSQQDWLFGTHRSLADMAIAPFIRQFAHTDLEWFCQQPWPHLWRWLDRFLASATFGQVMKKYPAWTPGQADTRFPAEND